MLPGLAPTDRPDSVSSKRPYPGTAQKPVFSSAAASALLGHGPALFHATEKLEPPADRLEGSALTTPPAVTMVIGSACHFESEMEPM